MQKKATIVLVPGYDTNLLFKDNMLELVKNTGNTTILLVTDDKIELQDASITIDAVEHKIIAANSTVVNSLPRPSIRFLKKYIELYNEGRAPETVFVEYQLIYPYLNPYRDDIILDDYDSVIRTITETRAIPRINSRNNTIIIKKQVGVNKMPKKELQEFLIHFTEFYVSKLYKEGYSTDNLLIKSLPNITENWINNNL